MTKLLRCHCFRGVQLRFHGLLDFEKPTKYIFWLGIVSTAMKISGSHFGFLGTVDCVPISSVLLEPLISRACFKIYVNFPREAYETPLIDFGDNGGNTTSSSQIQSERIATQFEGMGNVYKVRCYTDAVFLATCFVLHISRDVKYAKQLACDPFCFFVGFSLENHD